MSIVSLGIGSPASIAKFITFGLGVGAAATQPSVLADLVPAAATGDVIDADGQTNVGTPVTDMASDGTYACNGASSEYFIVRFFDDSTGTWHVMSGAAGYRVYVGGTVRITDQAGQTPADAQTALEGLGLVVQHITGHSSTAAVGAVARTIPPRYSLVNSGQTVTVVESLGPLLGTTRISTRLGLGV